MTAFATPEDLSAFLQTDVDFEAATRALESASSAIRAECGWPISQETSTSSLDGNGRRSLWIPTMRLTAVGSITELGLPLVYDRDYTWTEFGRLVRNGYWPRSARAVTITYTHGYTDVPDDIKQLCMNVAGRSVSNPMNRRTESRGPFSWTNAGSLDELGPGLTDGEKMALSAYKVLSL